MCGRYTDSKRDKQLLTRLGVPEEQAEFFPRYNLAPTQDAWVAMRGDDGAVRLRKMRWGLVPFWAKDLSVGSKMVNARSETVAERAAYRKAFHQRRCVILADGFYEWRKTSRGKEPHYIRLKNGKPFVFAGLWETWNAPDGSLLETFCILTGGANELVAEIHTRMPIILDEEKALQWLNPNATAGELKALLVPFEARKMESYPVSKMVNNAAFERPDCVEPHHEVDPQGTLSLL